MKDEEAIKEIARVLQEASKKDLDELLREIAQKD